MLNQHTQGKQISALGLNAFDHHLVDCAIWDLMSDFKKRNVSEICHAVKLAGYCGIVTDKRCKSLFAKKWFDRSGERGRSPQYTLKKSIKRPLPKGTVSFEDAAKQAKAAGQSSVGGFSVNALESMASAIHINKKSRDYTPQVIKRPQPASGETVIPQTNQSFELTPPASTPVAPIDMTLRQGDPVKLLVWKLLSDYKPYTIERIQKAMPWVAANTVTGVVSKMRLFGNITTSNVPNSRTKLYTMHEGVPMPEGGLPYEPNVKLVDAAPQPNPNQLELVETKEKECAMETPGTYGPPASLTDVISHSPAINRHHVCAEPEAKPAELESVKEELSPQAAEAADIQAGETVKKLAAAATVELEKSDAAKEIITTNAKPAPVVDEPSLKIWDDLESESLLDFSIRIKGKPVTREEAKMVAVELLEAGFGDVDAEPVPPTNFKMIEVMVRIMGMEFTAEEANLLAIDLVRNNFHL